MRKNPYSLCALGFCALSFILAGCTKDGSDEDGLDQNACELLGLQTRIINGTECTTAASPVVPLVIRFTDGTSGQCSGTVISNRQVLTAAHCVVDITPGSNRRALSITIPNGRLGITAERYNAHPDYRSSPSGTFVINDVAVVDFAVDLALTPLPVVAQTVVSTGRIISIFGYGLDENNNLGALRSGEMEIGDITDSSIIAFFNGEGSNTCQGDSGGPAIVDDRVLGPVIAGVTSSGALLACGVGDTSYFTNLASPEVESFLRSVAPSARFE